ncbi:MAG: PF20097 family protein [Phycisphaeraceae bacterium]
MSLHGEARCPQCHAQMEEGYIPTAGGLHWYRRRESSGLDFAEALPGTFSWDRRTRLPAWRCKRCHLIAFRYGQGVARDLENRTAEPTGATEEEDDSTSASPESDTGSPS